jgi:pantoate--beta-alanine ligase
MPLRAPSRGAAVEVVDTVDGFRHALDGARAAGRSVGLVPTMGALHAGHASLIERAAHECDLVAVTVFVNPLQFGPGEDLAAYPRELEADCAVAAATGAHLVFAPPVQEMYPPDDPIGTTVTVGALSETLEGAARPGHLAGVATVVAKLFAVAGPCRAYFGEKDYQQLLVVRKMARDLGFPVGVVACPTVRDHDGLALSSRNAYLDGRQRQAAAVLHRALSRGVDVVNAGERRPQPVTAAMAATIASEPMAELGYAAAVDARDLTVPERLSGPVRLLVAARIGATRLIDNVGMTA